MGEERGMYRLLVGKPEGRRPLGRPRRRWVDNIRMDLQEVGCGYMDWIGLAQDRDWWQTLVSAVMNLRVPWNAGNLTSCKPVSFARRTLHHGVSNYIFEVHRLLKLYKASVVREILRTTSLGDRDIWPLLPHRTAMELNTHIVHTALLKVVQISLKSHNFFFQWGQNKILEDVHVSYYCGIGKRKGSYHFLMK